jgi:hypothetical protein
MLDRRHGAADRDLRGRRHRLCAYRVRRSGHSLGRVWGMKSWSRRQHRVPAVGSEKPTICPNPPQPEMRPIAVIGATDRLVSNSALISGLPGECDGIAGLGRNHHSVPISILKLAMLPFAHSVTLAREGGKVRDTRKRNSRRKSRPRKPASSPLRTNADPREPGVKNHRVELPPELLQKIVLSPGCRKNPTYDIVASARAC